MIHIKKHAFFIPTTRECYAPIQSALEEISQYNFTTDESVEFVLLEQKKDSVSAVNEEYLSEFRKKYPDIPMHHIYAEDVDKLCTEYFVQDKKMTHKEAAEHFSQTYSYGMTYNRIFVIAALLGADYIHRRDSDVFTQSHNGQRINPFEMEMKYLGKKISSVADEYPKDDSTVFMVGGAYRGNWPISYQDIAKKDVNIVYELIKNGRPNQSHEEVVNFVKKKMINGCSEIYSEDKVDFYSKDMVEVGSQAIYKLFQYLPIPPAVQTSGLDYMINFLLEVNEKPIVYHNRRVHHVYTNERQQNIWNEKYHIGLAEYRAWYPINAKIKEAFRRQEGEDFSNIPKFMAHELEHIDWNGIKSCQMAMLKRMSHLYRETRIENYCNVAEVIESGAEEIIKKVKKSVHTYRVLLDNWISLMEYASSLTVADL